MNKGADAAPGPTEADQVYDSAEGRGWYLYGVTTSAPGGSEDNSASKVVGIGGQPVRSVPVGELSAVVSPVSLSDFSPESLSARAGDAVWLETMVRGHNDVIDAVHRERTILPAKFGSVYPDMDDLRRALETARDSLQEQLQDLRDADEWAVHLYADRERIEAEVAAQDPNLVALRSQMADARPGRAYFLQRKLADELAAATSEALNQAAQALHDRLITHALDTQASSPARSAQRGPGIVEILRAAYLVQRDQTEHFLDVAHVEDDDRPGMEIECTGPWPPYSFVRSVGGEAQ